MRHVSMALGAAVLAALILPAPARAQQHTPLPDREIKTLVEHRLADRDLRGVGVSVEGGVVTLSGTVRSLWVRNQAADHARRIDDVVEVVNQLTIMRAESDRSVAASVGNKVRAYVFYSIFDDIEVGVNEGVVTLAGKVTMPFKANAIEHLASQAVGVQAVNNQIDVLPVSAFDDQLRYAIATQIYESSAFERYSVQRTPPIHIIVEHGRVTLTGVVDTQLERLQAEVIARGTFGVLSVENRLRVGGGTT
jgi:hyperosmotically inducible protein